MVFSDPELEKVYAYLFLQNSWGDVARGIRAFVLGTPPESYGISDINPAVMLGRIKAFNEGYRGAAADNRYIRLREIVGTLKQKQ